MEKIAYRPQNVRETLVELKDSSELAIDLAYAAALYGHEGLAEEVHELEGRVNSLQYPAQIALMLAAKRANDAERLVGIIQIVNAAVEITNAAGDIAGIVLKGVGLPEEVRSALPEANEVVMRATVTDQSDVVGKSLAELALETKMGVHITAVRRGSEWITSPEDEFSLQAGDIVIGSGPDDGITDVYELLTDEQLTRKAAPQEDIDGLQNAGQTVIRMKNIAELAVGLSYSAVLFTDEALAAEVNELEARSDALKSDIETWVIKAGHQVSDPEQLRGLLHLAAASETICDAARRIADIVLRDGEVHPVFGQAIRESDELITTVSVLADSELSERTLSELELEERTGMTIMAIRRDDDWMLSPEGDLELLPDDVLISRGPQEGAEQLRKWARE